MSVDSGFQILAQPSRESNPRPWYPQCVQRASSSATDLGGPNPNQDSARGRTAPRQPDAGRGGAGRIIRKGIPDSCPSEIGPAERGRLRQTARRDRGGAGWAAVALTARYQPAAQGEAYRFD